MAVRADYAVELQLEQTRGEATSTEVVDAIDDVLSHLHSGRGGHRRGGRDLVRLLEIARLRASEESEWNVVRLIHDSIDYCSGRILKPDFEERYRLFQDGKRNDVDRRYVASIMHDATAFALVAGRRFHEEHPDASIADVLGRMEEFRKDTRHLEAPDDRPGRYRLVRGRDESTVWLRRVLRERIDVEDVADTDILDAITALGGGHDRVQLIARAAELKRRANQISELRTVVEDPSADEHALQRLLEGNTWIFGGEFVGRAEARRLVPGSEVDIPLLRPDGSLHIVELKQAMSVHRIVKQHRGRCVPSSEVHDAVSQALAYLVGLDEDRNRILDDLGIDARRASAVVLIGHPRVHPEVSEAEIDETLRTLNAHLARVEVLTDKQLVDAAQRSLGEVEA